MGRGGVGLGGALAAATAGDAAADFFFAATFWVARLALLAIFFPAFLAPFLAFFAAAFTLPLTLAILLLARGFAFERAFVVLRPAFFFVGFRDTFFFLAAALAMNHLRR
jgi:hypothetical protein